MTSVMLFCVSEKAKPFVPTALDAPVHGGPKLFSLIESRELPSTGSDGLKKTLEPDEDFESAFIDTPVEELRAWALEKSESVNYLESQIFVVVDERSVADETLALHFYSRGTGGSDEERPPLRWFEWRIRYTDADDALGNLLYAGYDIFCLLFHEPREEILDADGVVDMARIERYIHGEDWESNRS